MPRPNRGAYLSPKPNDRGYYEIRWTEGGRSKRRSTGESDLRKAQSVLARFLLHVESEEEGTLIPTLREVLEHYKAEHVDHLDISESRRHTTKNFNLLTSHAIADKLVTMLTTADITQYVRDRGAGLVGWIDEEGVRRGFKKATVGSARQEISTAKAAMNYCIANRVFSGLNEQTKPRFDMPKGPPRREHYFTAEQVSRLLQAAKALPTKDGTLHPLFVFTALAFYTAQRKTSIKELTWDRVTWTGTGAVMDFRLPGRRETKKRRHPALPAAPELLPILRQAYRERTGPTVLPDWFKLDTFREHTYRVLGKRVGPHILRHSWATLAANRGVPIHTIAGVLCDSVAIVERVYAKHMPDAARAAVAAVSLNFEPAGNEEVGEQDVRRTA